MLISDKLQSHQHSSLNLDLLWKNFDMNDYARKTMKYEHKIKV